MAIIFSYPPIKSTDVTASDKLIISKMNTDGNPTKTITVSELSKAIASGAATGGPYLPLTAGPTVPLTGDLYMAPNGAGPSAGSKNIVFRGIDDAGNELDGGRIFTVDSQINPSGQDLYFQNADDNGLLQTNLVIDAFGAVGIATTLPSYLLDVNGSGNFATTLNVGGNVQFGGTTDFRFFQSSGAIGLGTSSPNFKMDIGGGDLRMEENYGILFGGTGSNHQNFMIYTTGDPFGGNYPGTWSVGVGNRPGALANPALTINRVNPGTDGQITFNKYGSGTFTGTAAYNLEVDASGNIIETTTGGGGTTYSSTIDYQTGNPQTTTQRRYWIKVHLENKTVGSPDFGSTYTGPQDWYFKRQNASVGTQGGLPFNLFYNQYTPALDPGYDAGAGCGASPTCLRVMMEESVADINTLNGGATFLGSAFNIMTTDMAALSSYRAPLTMNIDGNGASPGNGTLGIRIIYGNNTSPSSDDDTCLPSTVSVYFRDTTDTSSTVGGPQFNLVWAGADTLFAQAQNGGATYTAGTDFVFSGNPGLSVTRRYELFFQDEVNAYNRCSYLKVTDGRVVFEDLPTVDPVSKGVLWNDAGDLKISLG